MTPNFQVIPNVLIQAIRAAHGSCFDRLQQTLILGDWLELPFAIFLEWDRPNV
jgi:hypothetical protein